jgi:hypothetical protein
MGTMYTAMVKSAIAPVEWRIRSQGTSVDLSTSWYPGQLRFPKPYTSIHRESENTVILYTSGSLQKIGVFQRSLSLISFRPTYLGETTAL